MIANDQASWKLQKTKKNRIEIGQCVVILYHFFDIAKLPKNLPEMVKLAKMAKFDKVDNLIHHFLGHK